MINTSFDIKTLWNCWIMLNYTGAILWWTYHREPSHVWYWASALSITACVTFGMRSS